MPDSNPRPWPEVLEEDRWLIEEFEHDLRESLQSPEELRARASELRQQAKSTEIRGIREASLALAERYEEAAAARTPAR